MTDSEIIEVVAAHAAGKKIQVRWLGAPQLWVDTGEPRWNFDHAEYRVAPEPRKPREWWINASSDSHPFDCAYRSPTMLSNLIRVREVLE